jgi:anti-sigma B factor antagonist
MVTVTKTDSICVIDVPYSSIDLDALETIRSEAEKLFDENYNQIIMNLENIHYLSSTGLGLLVYLNNKCNEKAGYFAICGLQDYTMDMMKLTKLDAVINIFNTKEEAIAGIS